MGGRPRGQRQFTVSQGRCAGLQLDVDMEKSFVPGVRRGYLVVPYMPRTNESEGNMHNRLTSAIQKVRQAHRATGAVNPDGQPKYLWLAYSHTPERRKRARYAGKVKRLMLEQGAQKDSLQVEFATGTLWYQGRRIASASATTRTDSHQVRPRMAGRRSSGQLHQEEQGQHRGGLEHLAGPTFAAVTP